MERKSLSLAVEIKDADQGIVKGVFSTFNVIDSDMDVTRPGAFAKGAPVVLSAYGHKSWGGGSPIGRGTIDADEKEGTFEGRFFLSTQPGRDTFETVKEMGELQEWSYGLLDIESERGQFEGKDVRFIKSVRVPEISPVLVGAGVNTRTTSAKSATFADESEQALAACEQLKARYRELAALRAKDGRSPAESNIKRLAEIEQALREGADSIKALLGTPDTHDEPDVADLIAQEYLRFEMSASTHRP